MSARQLGFENQEQRRAFAGTDLRPLRDVKLADNAVDMGMSLGQLVASEAREELRGEPSF